MPARRGNWADASIPADTEPSAADAARALHHAIRMPPVRTAIPGAGLPWRATCWIRLPVRYWSRFRGLE
jgi:hypothetical protein